MTFRHDSWSNILLYLFVYRFPMPFGAFSFCLDSIERVMRFNDISTNESQTQTNHREKKNNSRRRRTVVTLWSDQKQTMTNFDRLITWHFWGFSYHTFEFIDLIEMEMQQKENPLWITHLIFRLCIFRLFIFGIQWNFPRNATYCWLLCLIFLWLLRMNLWSWIQFESSFLQKCTRIRNNCLQCLHYTHTHTTLSQTHVNLFFPHAYPQKR